MKPSEQERLTRWVDGELTDDDVRDLLEAHPEMKNAREDSHRIGDLLRSEIKPEEKVPHADFFNHQIQRRIESVEPERTTGWRDELTLFPLFTRFRLISGFGFTAVFLGLIAFGLGTPPADRSEVVMTYTPVPGATATTEYHRGAAATVIRIAGIDDVRESEPEPMDTATAPDRPRIVFAFRSGFGEEHPVLAVARDSTLLPRSLLVQF